MHHYSTPNHLTTYIMITKQCVRIASISSIKVVFLFNINVLTVDTTAHIRISAHMLRIIFAPEGLLLALQFSI